ncbi:MAG TPA: hypothetical protein VK936_11530 [Longimicrobiales bacterium]|nr:hypothetical protein [Longimicrobiales bacterium]
MAAPARDVTAALRERAASMAGRVRLEAGAALGASDADRVTAAVAAALAHRDGRLLDDHDPRYLHPARTVLILLADTECRDPAVLAAASFVESVDTGLAAPGQALAAAFGASAVPELEAVPLPSLSRDRLLEDLVCAPRGPALAALAERLDQVRHLHLRPELDWHAMHASVEVVYVPAAARIAPVLCGRFERWAESFRRRLMTRA